MHIRRLVVIRDTIHYEGGLPALKPVTRVAACAVIQNPLAGRAEDDLSALIPYGEELGALLAREALAALPHPPVAYGKAAIVGLDGDLEHAAAIINPRLLNIAQPTPRRSVASNTVVRMRRGRPRSW